MKEKDELEYSEKEMEEGRNNAREFMPKLPTPLTSAEKKYLLAVERGDSTTVRKMLHKSYRHPEYINKNCVDPLGRGALLMSIENENLEMVELLIVMGVDTKDALLHAINSEFVEAVEVLLEHEEVVHKEGDLYSWEKVDLQTASFTPDITPLILAAHRDNYEILKILLDRGATLPMPHDIRCGCDECIKSSSEDSLRHSMSRINAYRALASPSLMALSSTDPILTAFELSWELKNLAYEEQEFKADYLELRKQVQDFGEELLCHTRSSKELAVILNHDPNSSSPYEEGEHMKLARLEKAIDFKQKKFVAHPNVQQLLSALWYEGLPGFKRKSPIQKLMEIVKVAVLFPYYCTLYMIAPHSATGKYIKTPFMKFLIHSSSYLFFLLLLILVSVRIEELIIYVIGTKNMIRNMEEANRKQRGNFLTPIECAVIFYVFGFIWEEIREMKREGSKYIKNMWNIMDMTRDFLYIISIILRLGAYVQQRSEISYNPQTAYIPRERWDAFDPQLISEGLFAAANILSGLKLVHIFSINPYLGPLQISLGRMVIDIIKFFFIYTLVLFAFACGLTQLLWYFNDLEKQKCYSLPGGLADWNKQGDACMKWRRFHNVFESSQSLFWAGFGMVGLEDFELTGIREYTRFWSMLMFGSYSVINIIVLLNLLIAMMSNSYSFIVEHADTEWKFARTKLWMSYFEDGCTLPPPFNMLPNIKLFWKLTGFSPNKETGLKRTFSSRTQRIRQRTRDFKYLGVMRAIIWRYVCALQHKKEERPVTEDDVSEVKGDISSLRYELIDLFGQNGMDISSCEIKSKAALGRKMRIWERRLMRDFYVSPAMGSKDHVEEPPPSHDSSMDVSAIDRFRRIAKIAMATNRVADSTDVDTQIGSKYHQDDSGRESLKAAMEKARKQMEQGTPDGSPGSSRGCTPYPDLYTGPHLMEAIKNLHLSPNASRSITPMSIMTTEEKLNLGKTGNTLKVNERKAPFSKKLKDNSTSEMTLQVPKHPTSKPSTQKSEAKKQEFANTEVKKGENVNTSTMQKDDKPTYVTISETNAKPLNKDLTKENQKKQDNTETKKVPPPPPPYSVGQGKATTEDLKQKNIAPIQNPIEKQTHEGNRTIEDVKQENIASIQNGNRRQSNEGRTKIEDFKQKNSAPIQNPIRRQSHDMNIPPILSNQEKKDITIKQTETKINMHPSNISKTSSKTATENKDVIDNVSKQTKLNTDIRKQVSDLAPAAINIGHSKTASVNNSSNTTGAPNLNKFNPDKPGNPPKKLVIDFGAKPKHEENTKGAKAPLTNDCSKDKNKKEPFGGEKKVEKVVKPKPFSPSRNDGNICSKQTKDELESVIAKRVASIKSSEPPSIAIIPSTPLPDSPHRTLKKNEKQAPELSEGESLVKPISKAPDDKEAILSKCNTSGKEKAESKVNITHVDSITSLESKKEIKVEEKQVQTKEKGKEEIKKDSITKTSKDEIERKVSPDSIPNDLPATKDKKCEIKNDTNKAELIAKSAKSIEIDTKTCSLQNNADKPASECRASEIIPEKPTNNLDAKSVEKQTPKITSEKESAKIVEAKLVETQTNKIVTSTEDTKKTDPKPALTELPNKGSKPRPPPPVRVPSLLDESVIKPQGNKSGGWL